MSFSENVGTIGITKVGCVKVIMLGLLLSQKLIVLQCKCCGFRYDKGWLCYSRDVRAICTTKVSSVEVRMMGLSV